MATTYIAIATVEVGAGGAANIEFTSIPATYTDLLILHSLRGDNGGTVYIRFNGDSGNNYSNRALQGSGSAASSFSNTNANYTGSGEMCTPSDTANTFGNGMRYIPNYAGSTNKTISSDNVSENNATLAVATLLAGLWNNTAAITSITLLPNAGNFVQYSTATLYGIKNS